MFNTPKTHYARSCSTLLACGLVFAGVSFAEVPPDHAPRMAASLDLFKSTVRPLFEEHCLNCHGGEKVKSAFNLNTREQLLAGGDQGVGVIPGKAAQSPMVRYMAHLEEPHMPPKKPRLSGAAIRAVREWIDLGAAYDKPLTEHTEIQTGPLKVTQADREFWSFKPLSRLEPPATDWGRNGVDRFAHARMVEQGFTPALPASRRVLIRRAAFGLTGLPPTPEEVEVFVNDPDPDAYEKLLDRLLASPHFGERWARHWLDPARFAESHGFEHDYDRKYAYHYRDFVIQAFNQDMPYDQFIRWQLAGDEYAPEDPLAMMATGFLGAGVYPTQITVAEAERIRYDAIDDMVATTGTAMLGLTIGCARCHDHKYDPIPASDYYQMASVFTTTVRSDVEVEFKTPGLAEKLKAFHAQKQKLEAERNRFEKEELPGRMQAWLSAQAGETPSKKPAWSVLSIDNPVSKGGASFESQADGSLLVTGKSPDFDQYTFQAVPGLKTITAIRVEALAHKSMVRGGPGRAVNGNIALSVFTLKAVTRDGEMQALTLTNPRATFEQGAHLAVRMAIDDDRKSAWALDPQFGKDHAAIFDLATPLEVTPGMTLEVVMQFNNNHRHSIGRPRLSVSDQPPAMLPFKQGENPAVALLAQLERLLPDQPEKALQAYKQIDEEWLKRQHAISGREATKPALRKEKVMVCSEGVKPMRHHVADGSIKDFYPETFHLHRGDVNQKGQVAVPGYLQVLMRGVGNGNWQRPAPPGAKTSYRRRALAEWITDVDQGGGALLARVMVNRLWMHHFGRGLVATPNDFGFSGERPSHPELLDWLAGELIRNEWRLKPMHKLMMSSAVYRLGQSTQPAYAEKDPESIWLWERAPRRLEGEIIRDHVLAVSGRLDPRPFGPGTLSPSQTRRSIYFTVKRSRLVPLLVVYDFPDTLNSLGRRAVTTTPSQALVFMNHPEVRKSAEAFARKVQASGGTVKAQVVYAHRLAFGRTPTPREEERSLAFLRQQEATLADFCQALMSMNEFIYIP